MLSHDVASVLKVMVTLTMTFACSVIYWWGSTSLLSLRVLSSSIAKLSSFLVKTSWCLDLCPQDHLLVRTNISTKFEGPNHKHSRVISFFGTKGHSDLDLWLKGHLLFRSSLPVSLIVLGLIIANGFLFYVKQMTTSPTSHCGHGLFSPQGHNLNTHDKEPLGNFTYQISKA